MKSEALGCHPEQARDFQEHAAKAGIPTEFTPTGEAILTSPSHRRKYMKFRGFIDKDGYNTYG